MYVNLFVKYRVFVSIDTFKYILSISRYIFDDVFSN